MVLQSCGRPPDATWPKTLSQWPGSDSASAVSQSAQTSESFWLLSAVLALGCCGMPRARRWSGVQSSIEASTVSGSAPRVRSKYFTSN